MSASQIEVKKHNKRIKVKFITFDKNLEKFIKLINFEGESSIDGFLKTKITYNEKLFPNLDEETYLKLQKELIEKNNKAYHSTTPTS